jgi:Ca2+-binding RTX toxin-like protein
MATINGTSGPNTLIGTARGDVLRGLGGDDRLSGLAGNDLLDGGAGTDVMSGGLGNDTYIVDRATDRVIEGAGQGIDLVRAGVSYTLGANLENLTLTGTRNINGTGNPLNNVITGNAGANVLNGAAGHDILFGAAGSDRLIGGSGNDGLVPGTGNGVRDVVSGGAGLDTVDYSDAQSRVVVVLGVTTASTGGAAANDVITGVESVVGSRFDDELQSANFGQFFLASGGGGHDTVVASMGFYDRIRGDDGYDRLIGQDTSADDFWLQYDRGMDIVHRFRNADNDHVLVSRSEFNLATPAGQFLSASELAGNSTGIFENSTYRLLHEFDTEILWADRDGNGPLPSIPIALFEDGVNLGNQIFVID